MNFVVCIQNTDYAASLSALTLRPRPLAHPHRLLPPPLTPLALLIQPSPLQEKQCRHYSKRQSCA